MNGLSAPELSRKGWLTDAQRVVEISTGSATYDRLIVSYRAKGTIDVSPLSPGVQLHRNNVEDSKPYAHYQLVDPSAQTMGKGDTNLEVGKSFIVGDMKITTISESADGAVININSAV